MSSPVRWVSDTLGRLSLESIVTFIFDHAGKLYMTGATGLAYSLWGYIAELHPFFWVSGGVVVFATTFIVWTYAPWWWRNRAYKPPPNEVFAGLTQFHKLISDLENHAFSQVQSFPSVPHFSAIHEMTKLAAAYAVDLHDAAEDCRTAYTDFHNALVDRAKTVAAGKHVPQYHFKSNGKSLSEFVRRIHETRVKIEKKLAGVRR